MTGSKQNLTFLIPGMVLVACFSVGTFTIPLWAGTDASLTHPAPYHQAVDPEDDRVVRRTSQYLTMRDGIQIAIDVYLPEDWDQRTRLPTMLHQTRYWRAIEYRWPLSMLKEPLPRGLTGTYAKRFLANGYAWVDMDVRGSGASFGTRQTSHSREEIQDGAQVVDWIIQQPWSDGTVGAMGISYSGASAELLLINQHPAVRAVAPMFSGFDLYSEIAFPGGIHLSWFTDTWQQITHHLDVNRLPGAGWLASAFVKGVLPVDQDNDHTLLAQAVLQHTANWNPHREAQSIQFRDDRPVSGFVPTIDSLSPFPFVETINRSRAAVYSYTGWFDGAYQHAAIRRHLTLSNPKNKLIIGPWDHGGRRNISPSGVGPSTFDHSGELLKFFDAHLKKIKNGLEEEAPIHYYTMVAERWNQSWNWPPETTSVPFYFDQDHRLTITPPSHRTGQDVYQVDPTAGTGEQTRWHSLVGRPIIAPYPDRAQKDQQLLAYTSLPLQADIEVTGHPIIHLFLSTDTEDATLFVYLEDLDKSGKVSYVTEGMLRAIHYPLSQDTPPYRDPVPYRTYKRRDSKSLIPRDPTPIIFDLLPTSYLFKKGHRIRIAISGSDRDYFARVPGPIPILKVYRDPSHPSNVHLPVKTP